MSTPITWTTYTISSSSLFDTALVLTTKDTPSITDTEVFNIAVALITNLGGTLGTDVTIEKDDWTQDVYDTDYVNKTFS